MSSLILRTATRVLMPLLLMFGLFLLLRGHNAPGGGFAGGLVVAAAFALDTFAYGAEAARRALLVPPSRLLGSGLLLALAAGLVPVMLGQPFLKAVWLSPRLGMGTPLVFDVGVFLVVIGVAMSIVFALFEGD